MTTSRVQKAASRAWAKVVPVLIVMAGVMAVCFVLMLAVVIVGGGGE